MKEIVRLALILTLIAGGSGLILSLVEGMTRAPIAEQRRQETLKALKAVLPPADNAPDADTVTLIVGQDKKGKDLTRQFFRGRQGETLSGVAFRVIAPDGYSGNIEVMVGVSAGGEISGIAILNHAETPGLGSLIEKAWFKDQFKGKSLDNIDWRVKKDGGGFDQITGATISPRAIVKAVKSGLEFFRDHQQEIVAGQGGAQ